MMNLCEGVNKMLVGIIMGSDSDYAVMAEVAQVMSALDIAHEIQIVSAHRPGQHTSVASRS